MSLLLHVRKIYSYDNTLVQMSICYEEGCTTCARQLLLHCIEKRTNDETKQFLRGLDNSFDLFKNEGSVLLYSAAKCGNVTMVKYLVEVGCDINVHDQRGLTPLMLAIENKDLGSVKILLENNADIYMANRNGISSLQLAVRNRFQSPIISCLKQTSHLILELMFKKVNGDFVMDKRRVFTSLLEAKNQVILAAVVFGSVQLVKLIMKKGYTLSYREPSRRYSALHWAVISAKIENAKIIIERAILVNAVNKIVTWSLARYIPECEAADDNSELLTLLLKCGFTLKASRGSRKGNLMYLLRQGNKKTVKTVLQCGIDLTTLKFYRGNSLLHILIENKNSDVLDLLNELGIHFDVNARKYSGETALMRTAEIGSLKKVEFLLKNGADPNLTVRTGKTALYYAAENPYPETRHEDNVAKITEILLRSGADAQMKYKHNVCITDIFSFYGQAVSVKVVVAHLASLGTLNNSLLNDFIRNKIELDSALSARFKMCTQQLEEMQSVKVYRRVKLFELLAEKEEKLVTYARNQQFKVAFDSTMAKMSHLESYYSNILHGKISKALDKIELDERASAIIRELTGLCNDVYRFIVYKIIGYLTEQDLNNLCKIHSPRIRRQNIYGIFKNQKPSSSHLDIRLRIIIIHGIFMMAIPLEPLWENIRLIGIF